MHASSEQVIRTYFLLAGWYTLAASIIWGVNTLFLLDAGLGVGAVFVANAGYSIGTVLFEIPTGVLADTLGRRVSFLSSIAILVLTTILYVALARAGAGIGPFFSRGDAKVESGSTNYGERDLSGNGWSLDGEVILGVRLQEMSELQIQGGYRSAKMSKLEVYGRTLTKEDGSDVEADYSGFQVRAGVRWLFGEN